MRTGGLHTLVLLLGFASLLMACGDSAPTDCSVTALLVMPQGGTADHTALPPGNQVQFGVTQVVPPGCAVALQVLIQPTWTTSDPLNTSISSQYPTNGLATCINATPQPAAITATYSTVSGSATLACR